LAILADLLLQLLLPLALQSPIHVEDVPEVGALLAALAVLLQVEHLLLCVLLEVGAGRVRGSRRRRRTEPRRPTEERVLVDAEPRDDRRRAVQIVGDEEAARIGLAGLKGRVVGTD